MEVAFVASPLRATNVIGTRRNTAYAVAACADATARGFSPYAPHLLMPQWLDDNDPVQRELGIALALAMLKRCDVLLVYTDLGTSLGMTGEIVAAMAHGIRVENVTVSRGDLRASLSRAALEFYAAEIKCSPDLLEAVDLDLATTDGIARDFVCPITWQFGQCWRNDKGQWSQAPKGTMPIGIESRRR